MKAAPQVRPLCLIFEGQLAEQMSPLAFPNVPDSCAIGFATSMTLLKGPK
jgi:hypothetical protein